MVMALYIYIFITDPARWSTCHNFWEIVARMEQACHGDGAVYVLYIHSTYTYMYYHPLPAFLLFKQMSTGTVHISHLQYRIRQLGNKKGTAVGTYLET